MIMDAQLQFSDSQAITATAASDNIVDLGAVRNIGSGEDLYIVFLVTTAFTDSGSDSTVTPTLEADDNAAFSSATTIATYTAFAALSAAGTYIFGKLPVVSAAGLYERYLRAKYTVANGNLTTGKISAFIVKDMESFKAYASGFSIS